MVPNGTATATIPSHLCSTAAECLATVSIAHGPRGRSPPTLFLFCGKHAQQSLTIPLISPQRQTQSHVVFHIPHSPILTEAWLYVLFLFHIANTTTGSACVNGFTDAHATPWRRILAGVFRLLF